MSGNLRRLAAEPDRAVPSHLRHAAPLIVVIVLLVVALVEMKPF